ncbi:hypothetical protein [Desulfovibrio subterraneus]|uniref:Uncharacterized protein n=1 Tax=Desulfovibrio subterraneus TaxID=2718620 RepID=A0A7J0BHS3_9BACT|nr:hypothetical protein [Desulfovibrio subterraneus]GFM33259.1 hypothetical protein DSM101010T_16240 [Desulfovibrio subterraneus]
MSAVTFPMDTERTPNPFELHLLAAVLSDDLRSKRCNDEWQELARNGATLTVDKRGVAQVEMPEPCPPQ